MSQDQPVTPSRLSADEDLNKPSCDHKLTPDNVSPGEFDPVTRTSSSTCHEIESEDSEGEEIRIVRKNRKSRQSGKKQVETLNQVEDSDFQKRHLYSFH